MNKNATTSQIIIQMSALDNFMASFGHDIMKFNGNVKVLLESLKARGETINDLPMDLFKGYDACSYKVIVKYIALN